MTRPDDAYSNANTPNAPMTTLFEPVTEEGLVRAAFVSGVGGMITWKATFSDKPVPALVPVVNAFKAEMPDIYGPIMLTWQSNARACEILRDGNLVMSAAIGGVWRDTRVESKKSYRYEVIPYTLAGVRGTPQTTSFTVPEIPQLGETPPKPDVKLDAIKPVKTAVGWGSFKIGTALNGPLRLGKESFVSGICIHADGYAVYARDPA